MNLSIKKIECDTESSQIIITYNESEDSTTMPVNSFIDMAHSVRAAFDGWEVIESEEGVINIIPMNDCIDHVECEEGRIICPCSPTLDISSDIPTYIHNAMDGRNK